MLFFGTLSSLNRPLLSHSFFLTFCSISIFPFTKSPVLPWFPHLLFWLVACLSHLSHSFPSLQLSLNVPLLSSSTCLSSFPILTSPLSKSHSEALPIHSFSQSPSASISHSTFPPFIHNLVPKSPATFCQFLSPCTPLSLLPFLFPCSSQLFPDSSNCLVISLSL